MDNVLNPFNGSVEILRHDRVTTAVTANINFLDIDLRVNGKGSEYYDYDVKFALHSQSVANNLTKLLLNNSALYSKDRMRGGGTSASASTSTPAEFTG
jgi:hypothetical protein